MKKFLSFVLITALALAGAVTCYAGGSDISGLSLSEKPRVVKVGWYESDGVHSMDKNGNPSGYDYDYLQAISQFTNWEYEYVEGTWAECYEWLKEGKIDLLNVVNKTADREQIFDYSTASSGTEFCCLYTNSNDTRFSYEDFEHFNGITVGVEEGTFQSATLLDYAKQNGFSYSAKEYPTLKDCQDALSNGEVDALLSSNTDLISGYKTIAQFHPVLFYFATTKGNQELLQELDYAMSQLFMYNPNFNNYLYSKYYATASNVVFTKEEKEYIASNPTVKVLVDPIWYPIESYDEKTDTYAGIIPDLIKKISDKCGINFVLENGNTSVDILRDFRGVSNNVITSITYDYQWAAENKVNITQPFIDASIIYVTKKDDSPRKTVALVELDYISKNVEKLMPNLEPIYYDSVSECIEAVYKGKADCAYMNNCEAEYFMTIDKYKNLHFHTTDLFRQKLCLGISKTSDPYLFSIVSKCLLSIPDSEIQSIIYENSYSSSPKMTFKTFLQYNPNIGLAIGAGFMLIIFAALISILYTEKKHSRNLALQTQRYNQLAEMTNEHIYEYDYEKDTLSFSNAPEHFFNGISVVENYSNFVKENIKDDKFENTLYSCFSDKNDNTKEIHFKFPDQEAHWYKVTTKIIKDTPNHALYAIGKIQDIQEQHEERQTLIDKANRDGLTGLYNAKAFGDLVNSDIMKGSVLIIIDIDHFKDINDKYGHYNGDKVLIALSQIFNDLFLPFGIIGRLGGDEFAVFLPMTQDKAHLSRLAKRILRKASGIHITDNIRPVTVSMGIAYAQADDTYSNLYVKADKLLYQVKESGRNNYKISADNAPEK